MVETKSTLSYLVVIKHRTRWL